MSLELILDILLSAFVLMVYRSDCQQQPSMAYACVSDEMPLWGDHKEYYERMSTPEDYGNTAAVLVTEDTKWVTDPMEDKALDELFRMADAIEPMDAEVAAELAAIGRKVNQKIHSSGCRVKAATVVQLRKLLKSLAYDYVKYNKAGLTEIALNAFANRGIDTYYVGDLEFIRSDDDLSILIVLK